MGFKTVSSGRFPCGFNVMGCLRPFHVAGKAMGLRGCWAYWINESGPKGHDTHNASNLRIMLF